MQKVIFNTDGGGLWSTVAKAVEITNMRVAYVNDENDFGELRVYFNTDTWQIVDPKTKQSKDGLIYTDALFLTQLRRFLDQHGLVGKDVDYSEQGMQGDNYVSLDVGEKFLAAWDAKFSLFA